MSDPDSRPARRVLEPSDRIAEVLFGLIMVLTFTGSLSVAEAGRDDVRTMLIGALGCNLAWGVIDGFLYLMGSLVARGEGLAALRAVRATEDAEAARRRIAGTLPESVAAVLEPAELESIRLRLRRLPEPPPSALLTGGDALGAVGVGLFVFLSMLPVALPFLFFAETARAMRLSNAIAVAMLFVLGAAYGRLVGRSSWKFGLAMVVVGVVLVAMTIALGG
jgi:hypothetical protein